jgi:hypothetical protein
MGSSYNYLYLAHTNEDIFLKANLYTETDKTKKQLLKCSFYIS